MSTWETVSGHLAGLALAPAVHELFEAGLFSHLPATVEQLVRKTGLRAGPLHVLLRSLEIEGWIVREGRSADRAMKIALTDYGRMAQKHQEAFQIVPDLMKEPDRYLHLARTGWDLPETEQRLRHFFDGFLAATPVLELVRDGCSDHPMLHHLGWIQSDGTPNKQGKKAFKLLSGYKLALSYRPLMKELHRFLTTPQLFTPGSDESHIDRSLDIEFSGGLAGKLCVPAARPGLDDVFNAEPLERQPRYLADTGCGDGALLAGLGAYIKDHTVRGRHLEEHPLILVGIDEQSVARETATRTLSASGLPFHVLSGDISKPAQIADSLTALGLEPSAGLHLSKSVLHDRNFTPPSQAGKPCGQGAYITESGEPLPNSALQANLIDVLQAWKPLTQHHGMLVFEAHTAPMETLRRNRDRSWATCFDTLQGLSGQYVVEREVFEEALGVAGYSIAEWTDLTGGVFGYPLLTMSWLKSSSEDL